MKQMRSNEQRVSELLAKLLRMNQGQTRSDARTGFVFFTRRLEQLLGVLPKIYPILEDELEFIPEFHHFAGLLGQMRTVHKMNVTEISQNLTEITRQVATIFSGQNKILF